MKRVYLIVVILVLFIIEKTGVQLFLPYTWRSQYWIVPHLTLISIVMVSLYLGRREGLWVGLLFGGLYDLVYGDVLGLSLFTYGLIGYTLGLLINVFHRTIFLTMFSVGLAVFTTDSIHYGFHRLFQFTSAEPAFIVIKQALPSSLFNMLIFILLYPIFHKYLMGMSSDREAAEGGV